MSTATVIMLVELVVTTVGHCAWTGTPAESGGPFDARALLLVVVLMSAAGQLVVRPPSGGAAPPVARCRAGGAVFGVLDQSSNSPARTPAVNAAHSVAVKIKTGPVRRAGTLAWLASQEMVTVANSGLLVTLQCSR